MIKNLFFAAGEGKHRVQLQATLTGEGIIISLFGGEKPHVGAVVLSIPRPSLADPGRLSCTSTVVPRLGHKDDEIAKPLAEELAKASGQPVVVVAGLHVERAQAEDINLLVENSRQAMQQLLNNLKSYLKINANFR
ncbi:hypothetical protein [Desulfofundulus thermosubterraneus]|uniref:Prenylated flavin chaperone LpdD-like domain-containing protein n=1 Tax=Desulfofundulus thermosubterraneus DSM 16057 TaxID=1121432 RepID=A0A1M6J5A0_9FIRM|nr:hypothetical protein [Desulfofundulus thermosubterraneus]SHJ41886.1 hypothetical protein SAMN02745219_02513 [Desulfofundulus thermosubterraneus DSM 16057]